MVRVNVYKDEELLESLGLPGEFHVLLDREGEVFWKVPEDPKESIRKRLHGQKSRGGDLILWCRGGEHQKQIERLLSIWGLWINGKRCEKGSYHRLAFKWPRVDLVYKSYRFEFLSPKFEGGEEEDLPQPVSR